MQQLKVTLIIFIDLGFVFRTAGPHPPLHGNIVLWRVRPAVSVNFGMWNRGRRDNTLQWGVFSRTMHRPCLSPQPACFISANVQRLYLPTSPQRRHNTEDWHQHPHRRENLKSHNNSTSREAQSTFTFLKTQYTVQKCKLLRGSSSNVNLTATQPLCITNYVILLPITLITCLLE
jgi:hypothetical protein